MGPFCSNLVRNEFSWKRGLFLNISIIYHHVKNQKNYLVSPEKNAELMDG